MRQRLVDAIVRDPDPESDALIARAVHVEVCAERAGARQAKRPRQPAGDGGHNRGARDAGGGIVGDGEGRGRGTCFGVGELPDEIDHVDVGGRGALAVAGGDQRREQERQRDPRARVAELAVC